MSTSEATPSKQGRDNTGTCTCTSCASWCTVRPSPSWRMLQLLSIASILLCVIVVYTATWGSVSASALGKYFPVARPKFNSGLGAEKVTPGEGEHGGGHGDVPSDVHEHEDAEESEIKDEEEGLLSDGEHPVEYLSKNAQRAFETLVKGETKSLADAAKRYREKRGRHPPPGFDAWYNYAVEKGAVVIEEFWDQIYDDLAPFWSIEPPLLRQTAHSFEPRISIREGKLEDDARNKDRLLVVWRDMLTALTNHPHVNLPDVDLPINVNEEPAMLVPWETLRTTLSFTRPMLPSPNEVVNEFSSLKNIEALAANFKFDPDWLGPRFTKHPKGMGPRPFWSLVRPACHPKSLGRKQPVLNDIWDPEVHRIEEHSAAALLPLEMPDKTLKGYVKNWTTATDACQWPNLQGLHGLFVGPEKMRVTTKLFPLFGGSKLRMSNEILFPGAEEWNATEYIDDSALIAWNKKEKKLFWRGPGTGGRMAATNWQRFHRHRFVSMLNATQVEIAEASIHSGNETTVGVGHAKNFRLLPANEYRVRPQTQAQLAQWVNTWTDVSLSSLRCHEGLQLATCQYLEEYFSTAGQTTMEEEAKYKYAAVIDGTGGDSASFISNLRSGRATFRASVYRQWFDSRVTPWLHFIPLDNTFVDLYGLMEYYLGTGVGRGAEDFPHAQGEVQKHEHHFKTPGQEMSEDQHGSEHEEHEQIDTDHHHHETPEEKSSQSGNEPHQFSASPTVEKRDGDPADGHETQASHIAEAGRLWAEKVLRRDDMLIYAYRLLLEYARVVDDKRERMGWVGDLVAIE